MSRIVLSQKVGGAWRTKKDALSHQHPESQV